MVKGAAIERDEINKKIPGSLPPARGNANLKKDFSTYCFYEKIVVVAEVGQRRF